MKTLYKFSFFILAMLCLTGSSFAQTTVFFEKMGTVTANTAIAAHETADGFDNDNLTMTDGGLTAADVRKSSTISTDGTNDANIYFTASGTAARGFAIEGIDASGFTNLTLSFKYRKETATALPQIDLEYWNGTAYQPVTITLAQAANATVGWYAADNIALPAAAQVADLKLRWSRGNAEAFRLDEVKLEGTTATVAPTISSTLHNRTGVETTVREDFSVSTTPGSYAGNLVLVKMTLANPAQAASLTAEYFEISNSTWQPVTFNASGEFVYGPATGFPLSAATSDFRITFAAAGTYNYALAITDAATGTALAPATNESVTVAAFVNPTVASTLHGRANVQATVQENFTVTTTAGSMAGDMVHVKISLNNPAQAADITLEYNDGTTWQPLTFNAAGELLFGPATGFPLANASTDFRILFAAAGTYGYSLAITDAATGTALVPASAESVTVSAFVNPTIASTLHGRANVKVNQLQTYAVSTTAGSMAGTMVKVVMQLDNPAQASTMNAEYFEISNSTWQPVVFDATGKFVYGPATGFPLSNATSDFRVTFTAPGVYGYSMTIADAVSNQPLVAATSESVTVAALTLPLISSTLHARTGVETTVTETFSVTTTANDFAGQMVNVKILLNTPAQRNDITLEYSDGTNWIPLAFNASGEAVFGPATGFPLADASSDFRIVFAAAGTYNYSLVITDATTGTALAPATPESVTVTAFVNPTIASDLGGRSNVRESIQENFSVSTTAGSLAGKLVLVKMALSNPAQASDITLEFNDGTTWQPLTFNASGELLFGPATGFPLANASTDFRILFAAAGVYAYALEIVDAATGTVVSATVTESVTVGVVGLASDLQQNKIMMYPNPASSVVKIEGAGNATVTVLDMTGRQVAAAVNAAGDLTLDVSKLAKGVYLVKIETGKQIITKKLNVVK